MRYMLILVGPDYDFSQVSEEQLAADLDVHGDFTRMLQERGIPFFGEALQDSTTATTLRLDEDGEMLVSDGPFVDLKEQIGGFYVIDVEDIDQAMEIAWQCPTTGGIEIRPVWEPASA